MNPILALTMSCARSNPLGLIFQNRGIPKNRSRTEIELDRLAETSPHLLADIGFHRNPRECTPTHDIWRRGALRVEVLRRW
ncbi:MAG: hypothetical protein AAGF88_03555 [Pseudomonadota bacterium]